ncbi:hypothetical protein ACFYV5_30705 [Streptomyces sp. NPDC003035]|uniref:hypothetical protein n=1 Tax=Streptomyces sp. NPDC003035 TaxID=3364676 RepID=UPI0036C702F3
MKPEKLSVAAEISAAVSALGATEPEIKERGLDGGGWMSECVMRLDGEVVQFDVMHDKRIDASVRLILEGWHFDQIDTSCLRQVIINVLSGHAVIKSRRTLLRRTDHVLKVASGTVTYYAWSGAFAKERMAAWEARLLLPAQS